jgi:hypothetical protein
VAALAVSALAVVPAVLAQAGDGERQDTVDLCHALGEGRFEPGQAPETDFYAAGGQGHGTDGADVVPPFAIENPRPGDPSSFPGRNWDEVGQELFNRGCAALGPGPGAPP